ncbi:sugar transferase [Oerskovia sp. M15]
MSLLHVDAPRFTGPKFMVKSISDWLGAAILTLLLLPVLIAVGIAVWLTSSGPVFYSQLRVGRNGETFSMLKFRSMRVGSDLDLTALAEANEGSGPLFKIRNDPGSRPSDGSSDATRSTSCRRSSTSCAAT